MLVGQHAQTGRQELRGRGEDGQLARVRLSGHTDHSDDITAFDVRMDLPVIAVALAISNHLNLAALALQIVEEQRRTRRALVVHSSGDGLGLLGAETRSLLEGSSAVLRHELRDGHGVVELVRVHLLAGLAQLLDLANAVLEVLRRVKLLVVLLALLLLLH